jgi:hypothetical protein
MTTASNKESTKKEESSATAKKDENAKKPQPRSHYKLAFGVGGSNGKFTTKDTIQNTKPKPPKRKKQSQFGKADPVRDICIFIAFVSFMLFMSYLWKDVGKIDLDDPVTEARPSLGSLKKFPKKILEAIMYEDQKRPLRMDCDLFLYKSSTIPGAGKSLFAGKNYSVREEIVSTITTKLIYHGGEAGCVCEKALEPKRF